MKIKKVLFITNVDEIDERLWSGTGYHLYKGLESQYDINHFAAYVNSRLMCLIIRFLRRIRFNLVATILDMKIRTYKYNKFIKRTKPDIVFSQMMFNPRKRNGIRFYFFDDKTYSFLLNKVYPNKEMYKNCAFNYTKRELVYYSKVETSLFKKCSAIFMMGNYLKEYCDMYYSKEIKKKIIITGGWTDNNRNLTYNEFINKEKSFLFVGIDSQRKGLDLVINAFNRIKNRLSTKTYLYVIGPNKQESNSDSIIYLGRLPHDEVVKYFRKCKVFVMPSRFDCYGLVFGEALTNGCICIASDFMEMKYFVNNHNGYNVNPYSDNVIEELSYKMLDAINNDELSRIIYQENNDYLALYNKDRMVNIVLERIKADAI